jgi:hypothetical protein
VGELTVDVLSHTLGVTRQREVDLRVGGDHVGQGVLGLEEAAVVGLAVAVGVDAGVTGGAVTEGIGAVEIGQHAARAVNDDHEARTGVGKGSHAGWVGDRHAVIGDATRAAELEGGGAQAAAAGDAPQVVVGAAVEVVVVPVAELAGVDAGKLELAGAAA